jgi:hypothetical protein
MKWSESPVQLGHRHTQMSLCFLVDSPKDELDSIYVQELSNFFERKVSAYQVGVTGSVSFDDDF